MSAIQTPLQDPPQDAAAAPVLSKDAMRAVIARRLRALGHPPDLLDNQAIAALIEHAQGSGMRLRAALAATLFLASTEDAPRIGRALVQRALQESGDIPTAPPAGTARRWPRLAAPGAVLACAILAAFLVFRPAARHPNRVPDAVPTQMALSQAGHPASPPPADQALPPAAPPLEAPRNAPSEASATAKLPKPAPAALAPVPPAPSGTPAPPAASGTPAQPAPSDGTAQPEPAATPALPNTAGGAPVAAPPPAVAGDVPAAPATAPPDLPGPPSASVVLLVSARDSAAAHRLDGLMQHLRAAGVGQIETQNASSARARRAVSYFFADDLPLAQRVTQILAQEGWPHLTGNSLTPRLVIPPPGIAPRRPGLIEIQLP